MIAAGSGKVATEFYSPEPDATAAAIAARDKQIGALEAALARTRERDAAPSGPWGADGAWIAVFGGGPRAHSMRL